LHATNRGSSAGDNFACNTCNEGKLWRRETVSDLPIRHHDIACNTLPCSFTWKGLLTQYKAPDRRDLVVEGTGRHVVLLCVPVDSARPRGLGARADGFYQGPAYTVGDVDRFARSRKTLHTGKMPRTTSVALSAGKNVAEATGSIQPRGHRLDRAQRLRWDAQGGTSQKRHPRVPSPPGGQRPSEDWPWQPACGLTEPSPYLHTRHSLSAPWLRLQGCRTPDASPSYAENIQRRHHGPRRQRRGWVPSGTGGV
jgi:hypothetical protein